MHEPAIEPLYVIERWPKAHSTAPSSRRALALAHLGLVLVSAVGVFSFTRVFDSYEFVATAAVTALVAHASSALLRAWRWPAWLAVPVCFLAVALTTAATSLRPSIRADVTDAWTVVNDTRAPVPPTRALVLVASLLIGSAIVIADWLAFRRRSLFGALLPGVFVFGLTAMYGDDRHRFTAVVLLAIAGVSFALAHRMAFFDRGNGWVIDRAASHRRHVMSGLAVASCAVLVALAIGPSLPGARNDPLVAWRDIGNGWGQADDGVSLAPLVSVRAQLVDQSDKEVFTVAATQPDYWRLTALDTFDGVTWSESGGTGSESGGTRSASGGTGSGPATSITLPTQPSAGALRQVVTINALRGNVVPAALAAVAVEARDTQVSFEPTTASVRTEDRLGRGDTFIVWSRATDATPPSSAARSLPRGVRQLLSPLVNTIVRDAGAFSAIDRAYALEDYFHTSFTYDLDVAAGSSISDIESFLEARRGYCEQFAATFAAMARVLGIPSRVAVGYRVGTQDPQTGEFVVTGRDAHAWAELYLGGTWVRFDPTPSGAPAADATNDEALAADAPGSTAGAPTAPTTTVAAAAPDPNATAPVDTAMDDAASSADGSSSGVPIGFVVALAGAVAALLVLPVVVDVHRRQRLHRRARHDPRALIMWWWHDALRWLRIAGADVRRSETPIEIATRAGPAITSASLDIAALAQLVTAACYSPDDPTPADIDTASAETTSIKRDAKNQLGRTWWLRAYVDQVKGIVAQAGSTSSSVAPATSNS